MSYENTPPLTLKSARDLIAKFHHLQSDYHTLSHQFGPEQGFKNFLSQGHVGKHEWINIEDGLCKLATNAEKRLDTGRNPTQAELHDFVNAYGRFEYLKGEFTRIRKQLEGRYFPYRPESVRYLIIGNQACLAGDMDATRANLGGSHMRIQEYSAGPSSTSLSKSLPGPRLTESQACSERNVQLGHRRNDISSLGGSSSIVNPKVPTSEQGGHVASRLSASNAARSPGAAAKIANFAPRSIGYSPNELEAGLHLMNGRQHLDIIRGLQSYIEEQNERIEDLVERIREMEATKKKSRQKQDDLIERVKELTEALGRQAELGAE